jgi:hypothetical protein
MSNKTFQFIWFKILARFYKRKKGSGANLSDYRSYMIGYLKWGRRLTNLKGVIIGDSNGEEMKNYESMKRFAEPTVNIAIGGTRADQWDEFIYRDEEIRRLLWGLKIISNVGGNNILQNKFDKLNLALMNLYIQFSEYYPITIPHIHYKIIANLTGKPEELIRSQVEEANEMIKKYCYPGNLIDIADFTGDKGEPYWFVHKDAVHYTDEFDYKVRIPLINKIVYGVENRGD